MRKNRVPRTPAGKVLGPFVCTHCKAEDCSHCIDVLRVVFDMELICHCSRRDHSGEPRDQQIRDPETGTVYAPGLSVTEDGEVHRDN